MNECEVDIYGHIHVLVVSKSLIQVKILPKTVSKSSFFKYDERLSGEFGRSVLISHFWSLNNRKIPLAFQVYYLLVWF